MRNRNGPWRTHGVFAKARASSHEEDIVEHVNIQRNLSKDSLDEAPSKLPVGPEFIEQVLLTRRESFAASFAGELNPLGFPQQIDIAGTGHFHRLSK